MWRSSQNKGPWAGQCKMTTTLGSYVSRRWWMRLITLFPCLKNVTIPLLVVLHYYCNLGLTAWAKMLHNVTWAHLGFITKWSNVIMLCLMVAYHLNIPGPTGHSQLQGTSIGNTMTKKALGRLDEDLHLAWIGRNSQSDY